MPRTTPVSGETPSPTSGVARRPKASPPFESAGGSGELRLDVAMVGRGLVSSRERAKSSIKSGLVYVNGQSCTRPSQLVGSDDTVEVRGVTLRYVSRGGLKLEKALAVFGLDLTGMTCVDLGASTGGFTDCMLKSGAARVFAVDVGHGQLDGSLMDDPRVVCMEGTDARAVTPEMLGGEVDFAATDVSFISLTKVLPTISCLLRRGCDAVCLIKPQFEAGRGRVGKRGVVRDAQIHVEVILGVLACARECGLIPRELGFSPIKGPEGNIEYLLHVTRGLGEGQAPVLDCELKPAFGEATVDTADTAAAAGLASGASSRLVPPEVPTADQDVVRAVVQAAFAELDS